MFQNRFYIEINYYIIKILISINQKEKVVKLWMWLVNFDLFKNIVICDFYFLFKVKFNFFCPKFVKNFYDELKIIFIDFLLLKIDESFLVLQYKEENYFVFLSFSRYIFNASCHYIFKEWWKFNRIPITIWKKV
mgnify:CR=1 FL=1